jgi:hypothetical protein
MTKYYLIIPLIFMVGFAAFHHVSSERRAQEEKIHAARRADAKLKEEARVAALRAAAQAAAAQRIEERQKKERDRAQKKQRDYEAALQVVVAEAGKHRAAASELAAETAILKQQLTLLRTQKEQGERDTFELAREIETDRIKRRRAELEIQRTTAMVVARLHESSWVSGGLDASPALVGK